MNIFEEPLTAKNGTGGSTEIPPAGAHVAVLVGIIDLGTHNKEFKDDKTGKVNVKPMRDVYLAWELVNEKMSASSFNHIVGRRFTYSFSDRAALRKLVEKVRGKAFAPGETFDVRKMLGHGFQVNVIHKPSSDGSRIYANFSDAGQLMSGTPVPNPKRAPISWAIGCGQPLPDWLPFSYGEALSEIIKSSQEVRGATSAKPSQAAPQPEEEEASVASDAGDEGAF